VKLNVDENSLRKFCRSHGIARLELFGSALREDFTARSDVDLLATLRDDAHPGLLEWTAMREELVAIFGRPVDLLSRRGVEESRNPIRRNAILSTAVSIYAEG
jgi:hypothetical protein